MNTEKYEMTQGKYTDFFLRCLAEDDRMHRVRKNRAAEAAEEERRETGERIFFIPAKKTEAEPAVWDDAWNAEEEVGDGEYAPEYPLGSLSGDFAEA